MKHFLVCALWLAIQVPSQAATINYSKDIAPILREYCAGCHNKDDFDGDFSVETFEALMQGGEEGKVIVPKDVRGSRLIQLVTSETKPHMPPRKEPQPPSEAIVMLKKWIEDGAPGPDADAEEMTELDIPNIAPKIAPQLAVTDIVVTPNGRRAIVSQGGQINLFDTQTWESQTSLTNPGIVFNALAYSPNQSQLLAVGGTAGVKGVALVWNMATNDILTLSGHRDALYAAAWSPDGSVLATAGYDRTIHLWNAKTGERLRVIDGHLGGVFALAFDPAGRVLASASADETIKLWAVDSGERLDTLNQGQAAQLTVAFSPDGETIYGAGADNRLRAWRFISKEKPEINPLLEARFAHEGAIVQLAVSMDGKTLVSSAEDRTVKVWRLPELVQIAAYEHQPDIVSALAFIHGKVILGRMDGSVEPLPLPEDNPSPSIAVAPAKAFLSEAPSPNDLVEFTEEATLDGQAISLPATISGLIENAADSDRYRFSASAGEEWVLEVEAEKTGSRLDSKLEILDADGAPVEQVRLQAIRDSWFTFRGKDSTTADDFRLQNWEEMELNQYLYANGEVVKLWLYPRGPDSGYKVYPGFGERYTYFGTPALVHPLNEPCYIVRPLAPDTTPSPNGLPIFTVYYENDDDSYRQLGKDSRIFFTTPETGDYSVRIADVRGFGGPDYPYQLTIRPRNPRFSVRIDGKDPVISPGCGKEFTLTATRLDGYEGEIRVDATGVPEGYFIASPIVIEAGQVQAVGVIHALPNAVSPAEEAAKALQFIATGHSGIHELREEIGSLGKIQLGTAPKVRLAIQHDGREASAETPLTLTIHPGETITATVHAYRAGFEGRIEVGNESAGRNLAHGVYVDNIGLNGLLITEDQNAREFFITAAPWVPASTRYFHLTTPADGGHSSWPVKIEVVPN